jgi:hypothetical protein
MNEPILAYELVAKLQKSGHLYEGKRYKIVAGGCCTLNGPDVEEFEIKNGRPIYTKKDTYQPGFIVYFSMNTIVQEVRPQPVPFMAAANSDERICPECDPDNFDSLQNWFNKMHYLTRTEIKKYLAMKWYVEG